MPKLWKTNDPAILTVRAAQRDLRHLTDRLRFVQDDDARALREDWPTELEGVAGHLERIAASLRATNDQGATDGGTVDEDQREPPPESEGDRLRA